MTDQKVKNMEKMFEPIDNPKIEKVDDKPNYLEIENMLTGTFGQCCVCQGNC